MRLQLKTLFPISLCKSLPFPRAARLNPAASAMTSYHSDLEEKFKQKKLLRSKIRKSLKSMDPLARSNEDNAIQSIVLEAPWFKSCRRLCAYVSCRDLREVDTSKLVAEILRPGASTQLAKKLYVPRVEDKNSHMRMLHITRVDDLIANSMNISEPSPVDSNGIEREDVMHANEPVDLLILPGLAFDRNGSRLGRGGGYYDTFLRKYKELAEERKWGIPLLVALSYSVQMLDNGLIPLTTNDVLIDAIVSPSGFLPITPFALSQLREEL